MYKLLSRATGILLVLYSLMVVINISTHKDKYQWDFYGYYECAKAYENRVNPYDRNAVSQRAKLQVYNYVYPPVTLFFFQIFTKLDYFTASYLYLILKCLLLIGLIYLWRNGFFDKQVDSIFYLLCLFAFNATIYLDLESGNISILEQFVIWLALFFYLKQRFILFLLSIVLAASFKIQPILFIFLILFSESRNKYLYLLTSFIVFALVLLVQYISNPHLFSNFISNALYTFSEKGPINPSSFSFFQELSQFFSSLLGMPMISRTFPIPYLALATIVILSSLSVYFLLRQLKIQDKDKWIIFLFCLVYALINPRFKNYSYILLLPPAYFLIKKISCIKAGTLFFLLLIIQVAYIALPGMNNVAYFLWNYYPLVISYFIWGLYLREITLLYKRRKEEIN
jgi:hypothetical protein